MLDVTCATVPEQGMDPTECRSFLMRFPTATCPVRAKERAVWEVGIPSTLGTENTLELGGKDSCIHVTPNYLLGAHPIRTAR